MFDAPWAYYYPAFPAFTRFFFGMYWGSWAGDVLKEGEQDRDAHRSIILGLAGFSFTAVAGLAVLDASIRSSLQLPIWYVLVSFVCYVSALNLQSYKATRWQNQLAAALIEAGSLSLTLTLVALLFNTKFDPWFPYLASAIALGAWFADHAITLCLENAHLRSLDANPKKDEP